jgi:ribonuclease BN (tRNA processing enzyme)
MVMTLVFHGVRGSHPVADSRMMRYGGNTSCVEIVKTNKEGKKVPVIIDSGSGFIPLGYTMAKQLISKEYLPTFPLLFTHLHPDHTEGFNFFAPNFFNFCTIYIMGMKALKKDVGLILKRKMDPPVFPIEYRDFKSHRIHEVLKDGDLFYIGQDGVPTAEKNDPLFEIRVMQAFAPSHPQQGALYYRITDSEDGSSIACIWDIESHIGGDVRVINFSQGADLMVHDTQYTKEEYINRSNPVQGFGHSTYTMAIENAAESKVKYLCSFHYSPRHTDDMLDGIAKKQNGVHPFEFIMSVEGLSLSLDHGKIVKRENLRLGFA